MWTMTKLPKWRQFKICSVRKLSTTILILNAILINLSLANYVESKVVMVKPSNAAATLIPGQSLHFECSHLDDTNAQFLWYKGFSKDNLSVIEPSFDDNLQVHNNRLSISRSSYDQVADYYCCLLNQEEKIHNCDESAFVKVRTMPYIDDFGIETSHTGKSAVVTDGERLELTCRVRDESVPVNITWVKSLKSDDDSQMVMIPEMDPQQLMAFTSSHMHTSSVQQVQAMSPESIYTHTIPGAIIVERLSNFTKKLVIQSVGPEHRSYYSCMVDNGVTERTRKTIFIRVKDKIVSLWPLLGIIAELFILFTIIHIWETQRAQRAIQSANIKPGSDVNSPFLQNASR